MRPRFSRIPIIAAFFLIAIAIAHFISFGDYPVRCTASLNRYSVFVGDRLTYTIRVTAKNTVVVNIPDLADKLSQFRIIDSGLAKEGSMGRSRTTAWYVIAQYAPGEYVIGPVSVACRTNEGQLTEVKSDVVRVIVKSTLVDSASSHTAMQDKEDFAAVVGGIYGKEARELAERKVKTPVKIKIVDIAGPISLLTLIDIVLIGAEIVLLMLIADWFIGFVRRRIAQARRIAPYETACREIGAMKTAAAKKTISFRECCEGTSVILKRYIQDAFKMDPAEFTTADFLKSLRALGVASDSVLKTVNDILTLCDLVKFSGHMLSHDDLAANIESAKTVIESLHSREAEDKRPKKK